MAPLKPVRKAVRRLFLVAVGRLPAEEMQKLVIAVITDRVVKLSPRDGLRFLFNLDQALYRLQGRLAVEYGGGTHPKHWHTRYHDFFVNRIERDTRVLDIGCGIGALAYDVAERSGAHVVGIDLNEASIGVANRRYSHERVRYVIGDALQDLPGGGFEVAILSNVLEHLPSRPRFLRRVQSIVGPSRLLVRVPLFERDWRVPLKRELGIEWRLDPTHCTEYTLESFADEMEEAGLRIAHQEIRWGEIWAEVIPV